MVKAEKKPVCPVETLIGAGTVIAGDILFSGGLRIDGEVRGNVRAFDGEAGTLVIGEKGRVDGNIDVARLVVNGLVRGRVATGEFIRLQAKARLDCDVEYGIAEIHSGAVVQGRLLQRPRAARSVASAAQDGVQLTSLEPAAGSI